MTKTTGILLIGHGTRDPRGQAEFRQVAPLIRRQMPDVPIADCFLELAAPDIAAGVDALAQRGVREIVAAPLLLFAAGHARRDIPAAIAEAVGRHDGLRWRMANPLGDHPKVLSLARQRFAEARQAEADADEVTLVIVSRGSSDPEAIANVQAFADALCADLPGVAARQVGFLAAATPTLEETLQWASKQRPGLVIVQPHLLFHGQLIQDISAQVAAVESQAMAASRRWRIAGHLGPAPEIVAAVLARWQEVPP